jgi:hypothetical protein
MPKALTSEEALLQAQAEGLTLLSGRNNNQTGNFGVHHLSNRPGRPKLHQVRLRLGGKEVHLGCFVTAEEAALCVARSPEQRLAAKKAAAAPVLSSEEALQQARAKGLVLRLATRARRATSACVAIRGQDSQESGHTRRRCGAVART